MVSNISGVSDERLQNRELRVILNKHTHIYRKIDHLSFCLYVIIGKNICFTDFVLRIIYSF